MKKEFKKGDYIVTLIDSGNCGRKNHVIKQRKDYTEIAPEIDNSGDSMNSNAAFVLTDISQTKWRYATEQEMRLYDIIKKPFDVTIENSYDEVLNVEQYQIF